MLNLNINWVKMSTYLIQICTPGSISSTVQRLKCLFIAYKILFMLCSLLRGLLRGTFPVHLFTQIVIAFSRVLSLQGIAVTWDGTVSELIHGLEGAVIHTARFLESSLTCFLFWLFSEVKTISHRSIHSVLDKCILRVEIKSNLYNWENALIS